MKKEKKDCDCLTECNMMVHPSCARKLLGKPGACRLGY